MKDYWVDFSGSMLIKECESAEKAKEEFYRTINHHNYCNVNEFHFCEVECVEEKEV